MPPPQVCFKDFFLDLKLFLQSNSVATSKFLILLHLVFTGIYSALLVLLMERTNFESKP